MPVACKHSSLNLIVSWRLTTHSPPDRYKRVLFDVLAQTCGEHFVQPPPVDPDSSLASAYITPAEASFVDPAPTRNSLNTLCPLEAAARGAGNFTDSPVSQ